MSGWASMCSRSASTCSTRASMASTTASSSTSSASTARSRSARATHRVDRPRGQWHRVRRLRAGSLARERSAEFRAGHPRRPGRRGRARQLLAAHRDVGERAARGARHPSRRLRQVRRADAAQRRRVHAVRRADRDQVRARWHAARRPGHVRARPRRLAEDAGEHRADGRVGSAASAAASSSRPPICIATGRTRTRSIRIRARGLLTLGSAGESKYWELETTGRYLASEHRDLTVSYVRSHSTSDLNDYDQFFGNFRNPIIRSNENASARPTCPTG